MKRVALSHSHTLDYDLGRRCLPASVSLQCHPWAALPNMGHQNSTEKSWCHTHTPRLTARKGYPILPFAMVMQTQNLSVGRFLFPKDAKAPER